MKSTIGKTHLVLALAMAVALLVAPSANAATPGITGPTFNLTAQAAYITQPDGQSVYSWGYGCNGTPSGFAPTTMSGGACGSMQIPGPTLIVTEGQTVTVNLINQLPTAAGNTSILFPGFQVTAHGVGATPTSPCAIAAAGLLTTEAKPGCVVQYTFLASTPGTRAYYSGTQGDLQVEMGMYGAIVVLPANVPSACKNTQNDAARGAYLKSVDPTSGESDFRLSQAAYDSAKTCYDREYLFQFSEMDLNIHRQAEAQVAAANCSAGSTSCHLNVPTEPYVPAYFMINGRSMPDDMDPNYSAQYPHQPYNGDPHMHPGELVLLRIIGQGRWQHPFHEHGNHVRILARDGNLIVSQTDPTSLAGPLLFTTTTTPGQAMDGIFYWTAKGLNWDAYGHELKSTGNDASATLPCTPDTNGYNTGDPTALNYFEWCQDHNKPLQVAPFGDVGAGGPATLPDPNIFTNGAWFGGSPYLGPDATMRATGCTSDTRSNPASCGSTGTTPPSGTIANPPGSEAGFAFMWHSHNEREITTNNAFPGGMLMMMLVDSREFQIDETN
jgi:FtsP/CotA-like multicopper oxidase with cupredoxin domain